MLFSLPIICAIRALTIYTTNSSGMPSLRILVADQLLIDNLPHLRIDGVHLLHPGQLVCGFQILGDTGSIGQLLHQQGVPLGGGAVDLFQVCSQLA